MNDELIKNQKILQKEAYGVLKESELIDLLSKYGTIDIGGSLKTGLMVWRDIDIGITPKPSEDNWWKIARDIVNIKKVNQITLQNNSNQSNPNIPNGYYIGIKYGSSGIVWKIDVWLVDHLPQKNYDDTLLSRLNNDYRMKILELKNQVYDNPKYRKQFYSVDIYNAVLNAGVNNLEEFETYLQSRNKSL